MGMPPLYAHGHLDALSFTLSVNGRQVIVDPGTYLYHNSGPWRKFFRSTAAHNTIRIDHRELSEQPGDFMFGKPYRITRNQLKQIQDNPIWTAGHDAYGCEVQRQVTWNKKKRTFFIEDSFAANIGREIELFFHLHPDCRIKQKSTGLTIETGDTAIDLRHDPTLAARVFYGAQSPRLGWFSPDFNILVKTHTLRLSGLLKKRRQITTCLILRECTWK